MRIAHHGGRLLLLEPGADPIRPRGLDVGRTGVFDADPQAVHGRWDEFIRLSPGDVVFTGTPSGMTHRFVGQA